MDAAPPFAQSIVFLYTDDLDRLAGFYGDVLGLPLALDQGACRIFRLTAASFVGICNKVDRPRGTKGVMLTLIVDDVDRTYRELAARGVPFEAPPAARSGGKVYSAFFRDPEGYHLEIQQFRDQRWPA